ncbi:adenylate cyclase type 9 isoform X2 [Cephus cinctus]|uniref:adenylate cyclase n=1 Tax=Cephus cinctus TaxID=211228 RepID=A0AAJ7CA63_CEPCN|nr:adenylate cyclase type 9 isoform X2 [Cephus cinctus]
MTPPLSRKRGSSVSFTRAKDDAEDDRDEIQISLTPYIQTYLAHSGQGLGCCGIGLPVPFERAASRSWWNPKFDSEILEEQFRRSAFPQIRLRFRYALTYILFVSLSWLAYFVISGIENDTSSWPAIATIFSTVGAMASVVLYLTHTDYYRSYAVLTSLIVAFTLCLLSLLFLVLVPPYSDGLTLVGHFALCSEILLLIYTVVPMPLYACVGICTVYSFVFEFLTAYLYGLEGTKRSSYGDEVILPTNAPINQTVGRNITKRFMREDPGALLYENSEKTSSIRVPGYFNISAKVPAALAKLNESLTDSKIFSTLNSSAIFNPTNNSFIDNSTSNGFGYSSVTPSILSLGSNWTSTEPSFTTDLVNATISTVSSNSTLMNEFTRTLNNWEGNVSGSGYSENVDFATTLTIRILMQICIHLIGVHILIMTFVRMRGTFMKVGQSLLVRRQLEMEKQLKEKMIHSVMPPKVADWLMEESEREREREDSLKKGSIPSNNTDIRSLFRPFNMHSMEDVSILFADIVGFTRMSSNKTAEELVGILNDLFERFDDLCVQHGCEKISTLGDCYYCVSGCPEPRLDHAKCCVEMGLAMIEAIKQFDVERREGVNMRVGVHTGTVLCGIVGTKRFKFDVWSNDVTLANKLESTGKPGRVHLSEKTLSFLGDQYLTEDGETVNGVKSYFIRGRKSDLVTEFMTNVTGPTSISPLLHPRHRLSSCNNQAKPRPHYLHMVTNLNSYKTKANSLPSILDSENDEDTVDQKEDINKSPTSTVSYENKKKLRNKAWRYLQRQRTTEEMTPLERENADVVHPEIKEEPTPVIRHEERNGYDRVPIDNCVEMDPNPVLTIPLLPDQEPVSHASSVCSRKDSGIRSNSRRSSIQQQLYLMNGMTQGDLLAHRVSGYYTSSSTLNSAPEPSSSIPPYPFPPVVTDTFGACFYKLRKQSDLQLIRCVQDNVTSQRSYFVKPPLSSVTLFFKNKEMEQEYRENAHKASEGIGDNPPTLATSRFNTYFDILISALVYSAITASLLLLCEPTTYYIIFCTLATVVQVFAVSLCVRQLVNPNTTHASFTQKIFKFCSRWYPWHLCGAILVGLPIISILMNFTCHSLHASLNNFEYYYSYLIFVGLVHFCNFTQLNFWMKNLLVTLTGIVFICLVATHVYHERSIVNPTNLAHHGPNNVSLAGTKANISLINLNSTPFAQKYHEEDKGYISKKSLILSTINSKMEFHRSNLDQEFTSNGLNSTYDKEKDLQNKEKRYNQRLYNSEIFLDMVLLLLLVCFLNREFEISYRLSFHGNAVAARDKACVQSMKNQADWLLHNIIPKYVADQLKTTAKYSQNHKSVGIIFASIVNFNELYDESYLGGKEYLRVLNELIGDFDELLEKSEFANVEKIKTIGSTFMAASGLNPQDRLQLR